jgi:hypothetical protein
MICERVRLFKVLKQICGQDSPFTLTKFVRFNFIARTKHMPFKGEKDTAGIRSRHIANAVNHLELFVSLFPVDCSSGFNVISQSPLVAGHLRPSSRAIFRSSNVSRAGSCYSQPAGLLVSLHKQSKRWEEWIAKRVSQHTRPRQLMEILSHGLQRDGTGKVFSPLGLSVSKLNLDGNTSPIFGLRESGSVNH